MILWITDDVRSTRSKVQSESIQILLPVQIDCPNSTAGNLERRRSPQYQPRVDEENLSAESLANFSVRLRCVRDNDSIDAQRLCQVHHLRITFLVGPSIVTAKP